MKRILLLFFLFHAVHPAPTAIEQLKDLRQQVREASRTQDGQALLQHFVAIKELLHDSQNSMKSIALTYGRMNASDSALASLERMADVGVAMDAFQPAEVAVFAPLKDTPRYRALLARMAANGNPVAESRLLFSLEDPRLLAEDLSYDPQSHSFFLTSVLENKILRINDNGKAADFARSPDSWPIFALKIDSTRHLVWATEVALDGFNPAPEKDWGRSALLCFDLRSAALIKRIEGPKATALGDLLLTPQGDPIVSDGLGGGIYKLNGDRLVRIDHGDFISPQTATMHPDGKHLFVPDYLRGIGVLELANGSVRWLSGTDKHLLSGIDGLYFDDSWLIATQNGTSPERVIRFKLDPTLTKVEGEQVIERASPTLGDPTHGVVVGKSFFISVT